MKKVDILLFVFCVGFVLSGCSTTDITANLLTRLDESQLKQVQYYTSDAMELRREIKDDDIGVDNNRIQMSQGVLAERIKFRAKTEGVLERIITDSDGSRLLVIGFEDNVVMVFKNIGTQGRFYPFLATTGRSGRHTFYGPYGRFSATGNIEERYLYEISRAAGFPYLIAGTDGLDLDNEEIRRVQGRRVG